MKSAKEGKASKDNKACQNPGDGFAGRKNLPKSKIDKLKGLSGNVYSYVAPTAMFQGTELVQTGCGLNFEGGCITLCTCKHLMRTYSGVDEGAWIAVFASGAGFQHNFLFALMRVGQTFESHAQLWYALPEEVRDRKSAATNQFGDVFQPIPNSKLDERDRARYLPLHRDHPHGPKDKSQARDVGYQNRRTGELAKLLLGDAKHSYLWMQPCIAFRGRHPRTKKWASMNEFLEELEENPE